MPRTNRIARYLRWHFARLRDEQSKFVFPPKQRYLTYIRREGDVLKVIPPLGWPGFYMKGR